MGCLINKKLEEEIELIYGKSLLAGKRVEGEYPVYGSNGIIGYHDAFCFKGPGIIIGRKGTVGAIELCKSNFWAIDTTYVAKMKKENDCLNYWYYLLKTLRLNKMNTHSAVPGLNREAVYMLDIHVYEDIKDRKNTAHILSILDDKIVVNNQINKILDSMAQAIFKHWFIDFEFPNGSGDPYKSSGGEMIESKLGMIPKEWSVVQLCDIGELTMGLSPKSNSYNTNFMGTPLLNGAADFENGLIKANKYTTEVTRLCKKNDLVFCIRATIGNITFADQEYCLGRGVAGIQPKSELYVELIYFNLMMAMEQLKSNATGSVILGLSKPDINNLRIIMPNEELLRKFSNLSSNILSFKSINEKQNDFLIRLRDTLLPKLMSGEIRVPLNESGDEQ